MSFLPNFQFESNNLISKLYFFNKTAFLHTRIIPIILFMLFLGCNVKKHNLRYFHFDYEVEIESTDGKKLELWIPVPQTNEVQTISQLSFQTSDLDYELKIESKHKNKYLYEFKVTDKYSNSGIVGFIFLEHVNKIVYILEYVISCRALGRSLEYIFLNEAIKRFGNDVVFLYKKTVRNEPFINFIKEISLNKVNFKKNQICFNKFTKLISNYTKYINVKTN